MNESDFICFIFSFYFLFRLYQDFPAQVGYAKKSLLWLILVNVWDMYVMVCVTNYDNKLVQVSRL